MLPSLLFCFVLTISKASQIYSIPSSANYELTTEAPSIPRPRHILQLSTWEKRKFLDSLDYIFSDIDGVVWSLSASIAGAPEGFEALKNASKKVNFVTNNSVRPIDTLLQQFKDVNLDVTAEDVIHPAKSIAAYLQRIQFDGLIYVIASASFKNILRDSGFQFIDGPTDIMPETFEALEQRISTGESVRAVIVDFDYNLSYVKLAKANVYLRNPECILIAGMTDTWLPARADFNILGPGPLIEALTETAQQQVITLGKPGQELANMLTLQYNIQNQKRALMIGDMLAQDIAFGKACGFQTLLVLSGGTTPEALQAEKNPELIPDYYADSMGDFVEFLDDLNIAK